MATQLNQMANQIMKWLAAWPALKKLFLTQWGGGGGGGGVNGWSPNSEIFTTQCSYTGKAVLLLVHYSVVSLRVGVL